MQNTNRDIFSSAQKQFLNSSIWCLLVLVPFFVAPLPHQQNVSLWGLFSSGETKMARDEIGWIGRVGQAAFGQKLLNTQRCVGRCACKSPIMKWANSLKVFKKIQWRSTPPLTTSPASTLNRWVLRHSPSGRSLYYKEPPLQKTIAVFLVGGSTLICFRVVDWGVIYVWTLFYTHKSTCFRKKNERKREKKLWDPTWW